MEGAGFNLPRRRRLFPLRGRSGLVAREILVIQHFDRSAPGHLAAVAQSRGVSLRVVRPDRGEKVPEDAGGAAALVVLGGPMAAWEIEKFPFLQDEVAMMGRATAAGTPTLGICLGAQLLAHSAGARNFKGNFPEVGWTAVDLTDDGKADPLFAGLPPQFKMFEWHFDHFDLPTGAVQLASARLYPNQAYRLREGVYGLQFHPEKTAELIEKSLTEGKADLEKFAGVIDPGRIRRETERTLPKATEKAKRLFDNFLRIAGL